MSKRITGLKYVGIDLDQHYIDISHKRIAKAQGKPNNIDDLFE